MTADLGQRPSWKSSYWRPQPRPSSEAKLISDSVQNNVMGGGWSGFRLQRLGDWSEPQRTLRKMLRKREREGERERDRERGRERSLHWHIIYYVACAEP